MRMIRHLFILILLLLPSVSFAVGGMADSNTCESAEESNSCSTTPGCYQESSSCSTCSKLMDKNDETGVANWKYSDPDSPGGNNGATSCYRRETIGLGEKRIYARKSGNTYVDGDIEYNCVQNATQNKDECICNEGFVKENDQCVQLENKELTLKANCGIFSANPSDICANTVDKIKLYVSYTDGLGVDKDGPFGNAAKEDVQKKIASMRRALFQLKGFFLNTDNNNSQGQVIDSDGNFVDPYNSKSFYGDNPINTTLYAHWQRDFSIKYTCQNGQSMGTQDCSNSNTDCSRLKLFEINQCGLESGKVFINWKCSYGSSSTLAEENSLVSDMVNQLNIEYQQKKVEIECKAQTGACPKNHYCAQGQKQPCPLGSITEKEGQTSVNDCFIDNTVWFEDTYGRFQLPLGEGVRLKYVAPTTRMR